VRPTRSFWSVVLISIVAVMLLQAVAGSPASPLERWLHVQHVPRWWPFILAGVTGLIGGSFLSRGQQPAQEARAPKGRSARAAAAGDKRGRRAVPRHVRRERERARRRQERLEDAEARRREAEEAAEKAARAEAEAAAGPRRGAAWLDRLSGVFGRRPGD
jgi:hypothetical protein